MKKMAQPNPRLKWRLDTHRRSACGAATPLKHIGGRKRQVDVLAVVKSGHVLRVGDGWSVPWFGERGRHAIVLMAVPKHEVLIPEAYLRVSVSRCRRRPTTMSMVFETVTIAARLAERGETRMYK